MEALEKGRYDMGMSSPPPLIFPPRSATLSFVSEPSSPGSGTGSHSVTRLRKNSAKMRKIQLSSRLASPIPSVTSAKSTVSKQPSSKPWEYVPILTDEQYAEKKERLLRGSKLKRELEKYWNIETPSRLEKKRLGEISSEDEEYDTDLDQELVGLELIVDEKTKQIKDDGLFPEYKRMCRKLNVIPNHYLLRHSTDDDIKLRHRYLSKNDCTAMGYEMKDNSTFSKIDLEDNGMTGKHIHALAEMLLQNHYVSDINLSNNPVGVPGAKVVRYILTNNTHIRKVDLTGCKIQDVGGKVMAEILEHNVYIKQLLLSRNGIGDESAIQFGKVLESNSTLEILDLSWNQINRPGAHALAVGLRNNHGLQSLILNMNGVGKEGGSSLIECLRLNSTLTILDIGANRIPDDIAPVIARVLPSNKALHTLKLSYNLITSEGAMTLLKPWSSKIKKKSPLKKIELDGTDVHTELALLVHKLREKRGLTVTVRLPPSRRERSLDPLMGSLMYIVRFCDKEDVDLPELFPRSYEEKGVLISTDDVVELIKHSGKDIGKYRLHELKRTLQETRDRRFELKELLTIHNQMRLGKDPQREDSLRSAIAGKRRGIPVETLQVSTPSTAGVRFRGGSDDED